MEKEVKYELMEDKRVKITFTSESADLKKLDNETVIGSFNNLSVCYVKDKETCIEDLQEKYDKYKEDLDNIELQIKQITVSESLSDELTKFVEECSNVFKAVSKIKDFSNKSYVANNPKKFGKMLKEARLLKENVIGDLKEIDKVTGLNTKRNELKDQHKLYIKEVTKISEQLEEVKKL